MLKVTIGIFNIVILSFAAIFFCIQLDIPSKAIKKVIEYQLSKELNTSISIESLDYTLLSSLEELWKGTLHVNNIAVENIHVGNHPPFSFVCSIEGNWRTQEGLLILHEAHSDDFTLAHSVIILADSEQLLWDPLKLVFKQGHLIIEGSYHAGALQTTIALVDVPLPMGGSLSATLLIEGKPDAPLGNACIEFKDILTYDKLPSVHGKVTAQLINQEITLVGNAQAGNLSPVAVEAKLPCHCSILPFIFVMDPTRDLFISFKGESELIPIAQYFFDSSVHFNGNLTFNGQIDGSYINPQFKVRAEIKNGTYESYSSGALLKNVHAELSTEGDTLILEKLEGIDVNIGTFSGDGEMKLISAQNFPFSLNLNLENITLVRLDHAGSVASGKLHVTGNTQEGKITGELLAGSTVILLEDGGSSNAKTVDITYINQSIEEETPTLFTRQKNRWPVALDISIQADRNLWITNRDLNSEWGGRAKLQGTLQTPALFGDIKILQGSYLFNGKAFEIQEGIITFNGEPETKTALYVIANMEIDDAIVELILKGSVKNPSIAFRSNPPMPPKEIVSLILFGRGSTEITPFQGAQLNKSITNLKTGTTGPDLLSRIRNTLGIDRIEIQRTGMGDNRETSLKIGKYLTRRVFVAVNKSMTSEVNRLMIEAALLKNLKVQAEIGDDYEGQLHLKWKHDY